jgi:hypothetical protein
MLPLDTRRCILALGQRAKIESLINSLSSSPTSTPAWRRSLREQKSFMTSQQSSYESWWCPYCGKFAALETQHEVLCDSKTCLCGAIALAAPLVDSDEIVDDALDIFGVSVREESRGYDTLLLGDLRHAGVEIREGQRARVGEGFWGEYTSLWFRRARPPVSA